MSEFVAHKIQIGLSRQRDRKKPDHLVQRHAAVDHDVLCGAVHIGVHLLVHQPERNGLVADQCLVVRLAVGHRFDIRQPVGHHVPHLPDVPLFVRHFFQQFDPEVGHGHAEPVVEPYPALFGRGAHAGHTADVLGNRDGVRIQVVDQPVGQRQVT